MPKLTAAGVRSAKPGSHSDGNGLILRVFLTGGKRWVWRGTVQGRRRDFGFGSYPTVSLKEARTKALEYLRIARLGGDPSVPRSQVPTLQQAAEKVIQLWSSCDRCGGGHPHRDAPMFYKSGFWLGAAVGAGWLVSQCW